MMSTDAILQTLSYSRFARAYGADKNEIKTPEKFKVWIQTIRWQAKCVSILN